MPLICPCGFQVSFGYLGKTASCCSRCKLPGMIHLTSFRCHSVGCKISATFGFIKDGRGGIKSCAKHKHDGMVNVSGKRCLACSECAHFNYPGKKGAMYCKEHKKDGMIHSTNYSRVKKREQERKTRGAQKIAPLPHTKVRYVDQISIGPNGEVVIWKKKI